MSLVQTELKKLYIWNTTIKKVTIRPNWVEKQIRPVWWLPSAYQEVEYIQSSWTQYIHTTQTVTDATWIYMKLSSQNIVSDKVYCWASVDNTDNNTKIWLWNVRSAAYWWWNTWTPDPAGRISITADTVMELEINYKNSRYFKKDGINVYALSTLSQNINYWINIFCHDGWNTAQFFSNIKVYEVKISSWNDDVAYLIPCYRKEDSVIWMYDLVNNTFYTNSWSWTFTKWPDVN
jgi:hypothetical protein